MILTLQIVGALVVFVLLIYGLTPEVEFEPCVHCGGTGKRRYVGGPCLHCDGEGEVRVEPE